MIFDIFWRKYSPRSQNALNPHLLSPFSLENRWFLRRNELFCARTVGFWEEMNFFIQEPSVFERKWTFLSKNRWFLRGNGLFYPRIIGFWEKMNFFAPEPLVFERKWPFTLKNTLELETKSVFTPKNPLIKKMKILNFQKILNPQKKNSSDPKKSIAFEKLSNRTLQYQHFFSLATISTPPLQKILEKQKAQPDQKLKSCYSSPKSSSKFGSVADWSGSSSRKVESCGFFWSNFGSESSKSW